MSSIIRADRWQNSDGVAYNSVLQVVSTAKTDTFTTTSTSYAEITGLSATITPRFSTSKILVMLSIDAGSSTDVLLAFRLMRGTTAVGIADASGTRTLSTMGRYLGTATTGGGTHVTTSSTFLDSPATTSSTTYSVQVFQNLSGTICINRSSSDGDGAGTYRAISTITVMEIAQ